MGKATQTTKPEAPTEMAQVTAAQITHDAIDPSELTWCNAVRRPRQPLHFSVADQPMTIAWRAASTRFVPAYALTLEIDQAQAQVALNREGLRVIEQRLGLPCKLLECAADMSALWVEYCLAPVIEALENQLACAIRFSAARDAGDPQSSMSTLACLALDTGHEKVELQLLAQPRGQRRLAELLNRHWPLAPSACRAVPFAVRWIAGRQRLTFGQLKTLRAGDVVLLEQPRHGAWIVTGELVIAQARDDTPRLMSEPEFNPFFVGESAMAEPSKQKQQQPDDEAKPAAQSSAKDASTDALSPDAQRLDSLPVGLVCEFGRIDMPLADIRTLAKGHVLDLKRAPDSSVDIVVNGRILGRGRLVQIGDSLGVQIENLALDD